MFDDMDLDFDGEVDSEDEFLADCLLLDWAEERDESTPFPPLSQTSTPPAGAGWAVALILLAFLCFLFSTIG